eukprot:353182-Chlamydomonas_euryale.AAC.1
MSSEAAFALEHPHQAAAVPSPPAAAVSPVLTVPHYQDNGPRDCAADCSPQHPAVWGMHAETSRSLAACADAVSMVPRPVLQCLRQDLRASAKHGVPQPRLLCLSQDFAPQQHAFASAAAQPLPAWGMLTCDVPCANNSRASASTTPKSRRSGAVAKQRVPSRVQRSLPAELLTEDGQHCRAHLRATPPRASSTGTPGKALRIAALWRQHDMNGAGFRDICGHAAARSLDFRLTDCALAASWAAGVDGCAALHGMPIDDGGAAMCCDASSPRLVDGGCALALHHMQM